MPMAKRDMIFVLASVAIGVLIAMLVRAGVVREDGALPPLLLIFVGMAVIELAAGAVAKVQLGQFVAMPARLIALAAAFGAYMLLVRI